MQTLKLFFSSLMILSVQAQEGTVKYRPTPMKFGTEVTAPAFKLEAESYTDMPLLTGPQLSTSPLPAETVTCGHDVPRILTVEAQKMSIASIKAVDNLSCSNILTGNLYRFSHDNCLNITNCAKIKTESRNRIEGYQVPKYVAEDFLNMRFSRGLRKMERLEILRKFAQKKYGKEAVKNCASPFNYDKKNAKSCEINLVDDAFAKSQRNCSVMKKGCFNSARLDNGFESFIKDYKPVEGQSKLQSFFSTRTDVAVNEGLANSTEILQNIAPILNSKVKEEEKIQQVFDRLAEFKKNYKLDPFFEYYLEDYDSNKNIKKSPLYSFFTKLLKSKKTIDLSAIEKERKDLLKGMIGESCKSHLFSVAEMCVKATNIAHSRPILQKEPAKFAESLPIEDTSDERFESMKSAFPAGIKSKDDLRIVLDAQRCRLLGYFRQSNDPFNVFPDVVDSENPRDLSQVYTGTDTASLYGFGQPLTTSSAISSTGGQVRKDDTKPEIIDVEPAIAQDKIEASKPLEQQILADSAQTALSPNPQQAQQPFQNSYYAPVDEAAKPVVAKPAGPSDVQDNLGNSAINSRIDELTKQLEAAQQSLAQIQKGTKGEGEEDAGELSDKDEKEDDTIKSLRSQIAELKKSQTIKDLKKEVAAVKVEASKDIPPAEIQSQVFSKETTATTTLAPATRIESSVAIAPSTPVESSSAQAVAAGQNSQSFSQSGKSGPVLTVDSSNREKAATTINEKIKELNGEPFLIEEDGMIKEIIPVVKDGKIQYDEKGEKPLFTKVVRGKIGDKKFAKADVKPSRAPAAIDNNADLKRLEEERLKRERAEYLKLKALTEGALHKK